jgi:hypothetical protein
MLAFKPLPVLSSLLFTYLVTKQSMRNPNAAEVVDADIAAPKMSF